ncbi:MAG: Na/Pi cotransporter family protein [Clostridia bacterium]|nr:Na/Pi cotransporter family protein [Clostridia bacterium]
MATEILTMAALLLGGLTFFIYGMSVMSDNLKNAAGNSIERSLNKIASNDLLGFLLGAGITIAIQSSSAMTVMLVSLVNSGILEFRNTFGVIMGSNVGTTLTAWLFSFMGIDKNNLLITLFKPMTFAPFLAFCGLTMKMISKSERKQNIGLIFIGFAILMFGMEFMSESMKNIRTLNGFDLFLITIKNPISALLISTIFTGIIQSSAATIAIVQSLALSGGITLEMAIPLVLGANIGTCVTALISSIGTNKAAKQLVIMHFLVNILGSMACMLILYFFKCLNLEILSNEISIVSVAIIHTLFNVLNTVFLIPFKSKLIKLCEFIMFKNHNANISNIKIKKPA